MVAALSPVHFFSHGSTMMLGEECPSATYWKQCGDEALANGIKGGAHWDCKGENRIEIATNPDPEKTPVAYVNPDKYVNYKPNPDIPTALRCIKMLREKGIDARENPKFNWIHDTYLILIRMFPNGCPPTVLISQNARADPHFHMRVGSYLRPLRKEGYLLIGSGGSVHNLYRNQFPQMVAYRDNFAMPVPPGPWALEFRQAFEDAVTKNSGPELRRAVTRMMKHPEFREAHGTDEHFIPAAFIAGAVGDVEDYGTYGRLAAEDWELVNMCNSQYTFGGWVK